MDQERRRLAVICSHLDPTTPHRQRPGPLQPSAASSSDGSAKGESSDDDPCVFCEISRGQAPAFKLYEDDICLCILDSNPLTNGHSLIITKCHYPSLGATPPHWMSTCVDKFIAEKVVGERWPCATSGIPICRKVVAAMCSKVPFLSNAIMKATQSDSFNLLVNSGSAAGQVIFHTHFHIIPRKAGDKLWPSENSRRQPIKYNQNTVVLLDCIREQLSSSSNDGRISCESMLSKN